MTIKLYYGYSILYFVLEVDITGSFFTRKIERFEQDTYL
jgi:hypothetical protein